MAFHKPKSERSSKEDLDCFCSILRKLFCLNYASFTPKGSQVYKNFSSVLTRDLKPVFSPNLAILQECGVPESFVRTHLVIRPRMFAENHDKFRRTAEEVKKMGFDPLRQLFLIAFQALIGTSKSLWEKKSIVFKQCGWTDEDVVSAFEKYPRCMILSEHNITATMKFYVKTMGFKSSYIAIRPALLSYSLERSLIPRYSVLQALLSKGLIDKFSASSLVCSEKLFLQRFVTSYEDPYLLKLYEEKRGLS
ncbi:hypothetical protein PTKIN_Ptkin16aG0091300 [Pterospermum kingtungense]